MRIFCWLGLHRRVISMTDIWTDDTGTHAKSHCVWCGVTRVI